LSEIEFFKASPKWFKDALKKIEVESQLLGKKLNLHEFYAVLEKRIEEDENFVARRYVELGQYKPCVMGLLQEKSSESKEEGS
jgi:hypothetical protein